MRKPFLTRKLQTGRRGSGRRGSRSRQSGYVLVMTIAALALLGLAGAYIGERVSSALRLAAAEQEFAKQDKLLRDGMDNAVYLLATVKRSRFGLGGDTVAIRLDGRWYDNGKGMAISLQDAFGLLNIKTAPLGWKQQMLAGYGVPTERIGYLLDALDDYIDTDSLRRLQGAEAADYQGKELPPRNHLLLNTSELLRVYGWRTETKLWGDDPLLDHLVLAEGTGVNPATASWRVLAASLGLSESAAKDFVVRRQDADLPTLTQLAAPFTTPSGGLDIFKLHTTSLFPSATTVITVAPIGSRRALRATLTITPDQQGSPWTLNDVHEISLAKPLPGKLPKLPDVSPYTVNIEQEHIVELPF
ncbi:general secretion pathway protein GspK [Chitinimonas arctica]|uniref:General secretion pathway protein GspK n=1 Tax=Chitinimonas arctica TaxID=2594795 RepID=A0A516SGF6_9NEIS|nr:type II secretion system protein GspK [Chitinimonas arctica]QDQ27244.1 general secretion pathway protein GspK [Chitinimonas arctica]